MKISKILGAVALTAGVSGNVLADDAVTVKPTPSGHADATSVTTHVPNKPIKILSQSEPSCWEEWRLTTGKNRFCLTSRVIEVEEVAVAYLRPPLESDTKTLPTNYSLETLMRTYSQAVLCVTNSKGGYCQSNQALILEVKPK
jgi:hypothetical protein